MQIGNVLIKEKSLILPDGTEQHLTRIERTILMMLAEVLETDVAKVTIMTALYGSNTRCNSRSLDVHICHLRTKLKGSYVTIYTNTRFGFRLTVNIEQYAQNC